MSKLIDADALEKDGWMMHRTVRVDKDTMEYQTKKPTDFPPIEPEPQWILCKERLPEDGTEVFIYLFDRPSPYIAWIEDTHWCTEDFEVDKEDEPIAWMPLPSPY